MEREIKVVVNVNDEKHALQICEDIYEVVRMRTTIYDIAMPCPPEEFIETRFKNRHPSYVRERDEILKKVKK